MSIGLENAAMRAVTGIQKPFDIFIAQLLNKKANNRPVPRTERPTIRVKRYSRMIFGIHRKRQMQSLRAYLSSSAAAYSIIIMYYMYTQQLCDATR